MRGLVENISHIILFVVALLFVVILTIIYKSIGAELSGKFLYAITLVREKAKDLPGTIVGKVLDTVKKICVAMVAVAVGIITIKALKKFGPTLGSVAIIASLAGIYAGAVYYLIYKPIKSSLQDFKGKLQDVVMTIFEMANPEYFKFLVNARNEKQIISYLKNYILKGAFEGNLWKNFRIIATQKFTKVNLTNFDQKVNKTMLGYTQGILFFSTNCSLTKNESGIVLYYYVPPWIEIVEKIKEELPKDMKDELKYDDSKIFMFPVGYAECGNYLVLILYPLESEIPNFIVYRTFGIDVDSGEYHVFEINVSVEKDNSTINFSNFMINSAKVFEIEEGFLSKKKKWKDIWCYRIYYFFKTRNFKVFYPGVIYSDYWGSEAIKKDFKEKLGLNRGIIMEVICLKS